MKIRKKSEYCLFSLRGAFRAECSHCLASYVTKKNPKGSNWVFQKKNLCFSLQGDNYCNGDDNNKYYDGDDYDGNDYYKDNFDPSVLQILMILMLRIMVMTNMKEMMMRNSHLHDSGNRLSLGENFRHAPEDSLKFLLIISELCLNITLFT